MFLLGQTASAGGQSKSYHLQCKRRPSTLLHLPGALLILCGVFCPNPVAFTYTTADEHGATDDHIQTGNLNAAAGFGFACFLYLLAFCMFLGMAVYVSPIIMGSNNEKQNISRPTEAGGDSDYQQYTDSETASVASAPPMNAV